VPTAVPFPPVEPAPSAWALRGIAPDADEDLVALGADLEPGTLLAAYRMGLFPMGVGVPGTSPLGWWSPTTRGVLPPGALRVSRSLRRAMRRFEIRVDTVLPEVVDRCADPARPGGWISVEIAAAYRRLHELGWVHSVETWQEGELVGGLYGVCVGGLFAGESMFHTVDDASKAALVGLVERFFADGDPRRLIDAQWPTEHLVSLGVVSWSRADYLGALARALEAPQVDLAAAEPDVRPAGDRRAGS
jgi:leucyl/phenylalanyl-tRNA--protein transferase